MNWTQADLDERNRRILGVEPPRASIIAGGPDVPESEIQAEITKRLEGDGWRALRTDPVSDRGRGKGFGEVGMADALMIRYDFSRQAAAVDRLSDIGYDGLVDGETRHTLRAYADVMWIEFKRPGEKAKKHQQAWHAKERARGALTLIAGQDFPASVEGFVGWYKASGLLRSKVNW